MNAKNWLVLNFKIGALSLGGGGRAIYYHEGLVKTTKVITDDEFQEAATITQLVPGPNLVNLGIYLGMRLVGWKWMLLGFFLLCLPGAIAGALFIGVVDLNDPNIMLLFKGFSLGSVTFFGIFVYRLANGLTMGIKKRASLSRVMIRVLLAAVVASCSLYGIPLFWVLVCGIPVTILLEFQLWD